MNWWLPWLFVEVKGPALPKKDPSLWLERIEKRKLLRELGDSVCEAKERTMVKEKARKGSNSSSNTCSSSMPSHSSQDSSNNSSSSSDKHSRRREREVSKPLPAAALWIPIPLFCSRSGPRERRLVGLLMAVVRNYFNVFLQKPFGNIWNNETIQFFWGGPELFSQKQICCSNQHHQ